MKSPRLPDTHQRTQAEAQRQIMVLACLLLVLLGLAVSLNRWLEKQTAAAQMTVGDEPLYATDAGVRRSSLAFAGLVADWYWMRSLQYIGSKVLSFRAANPGQQLSLDDLTPLNPKQLYPLLDRATTLDPQFIAAYEYGGVVLPAINEADAIRLLNKGITNNPNTWRLYHHLGYLYWQRKEYETASQIYLQASHLPDAPRWLLQMSAQMKAAGGSYDVARDMYRQMADAADNPEIKKLAESRLLQIHSLEERDAIRQALQDFRARHGRCPAQWQEITAALRAVRLSNKQPLYFDAAGVPLDPADTPYRLTENGCQVDLDPKSRVPYK